MFKTSSISTFIVVFIITSGLICIIGQGNPWSTILPSELLELNLATKIRVDPQATNLASTDFGNLTRSLPAAVLYPSTVKDIATLIQASYSASLPFPIAAKGHGHSIHGQAQALDGVVIEMSSLKGGDKSRINVSTNPVPYYYADVGGEQLWIDVLQATLQHGLTPVSWTDYLHLTVGGTLSNAGISGQAFRHGPQISNVYELDVVTDYEGNKLDRQQYTVTVASWQVRWLRLLYIDFLHFIRDQEYLISIKGVDSDGPTKGFDYVEGSLITDESLIKNWRSSFFSPKDHGRISALAAQHGTIYCLEVSKYYSHFSVEQDVDSLLNGLSFPPGYAFANDVSYTDFLERVHHGEQKLRTKGLWDVPHPWLNLFIPKSRIVDFDRGVFKGVLKRNATMGPILIYPMNKYKWDERTSAVTPNEEVFYTVGLLQSATDGWEYLEDQNREILNFCNEAGIRFKQYLPHYSTNSEWKKHFGRKWNMFVERKMKFDPKRILSPGQRIFTPLALQEPNGQGSY
ncbi:cytokinin dehydrogenase 6 [Cinnamomum micranthum f. kanehirae]|uniref:cytokinin dehydrogenase n=1 Tax=Cinnamomum micranthum f. kanehirae TaxID=337451 RepID=A0A443NW71_9MAGN|nr:cytokinin dehydrogenase 6 [Cinnamomum micranthum f. kanehirae]